MKNIILLLAIMFAANSASAQWSNDLYGNPIPTKKRQTQSSSSKASVQSNTYASSSSNYTSSSHQNADDSELVTSYEKALRRRYNAMRNATNEQPESYWKLMEQYQSMLEKKYNQNLYNIVVVGDEMWVEPQSITALFDGSDPAAGVVQYNQEIRNGSFNGGYSSNNDQQNITIQINVIDPWDSWGHSSWLWDRPYYSSPYYWGGYWGGYYRPYWGGYYPSYWAGGYHHNHWGPSYWGGGYNNYYRNPKGAYYGNSRNDRYSNRPSYYGNSSRPNYGSAGAGMGSGRPSRPNGSNTVYGNSARPTRGSSGGITTNRPQTSSYDRPSSSGRPSSGTVGRPTTNNRPNSTTVRPNVERPKYERTNPNTQQRTTTYERPKTERPASVSRPASTSRSSGSSNSGGGSSSGSGSGGGRPTRR